MKRTLILGLLLMAACGAHTRRYVQMRDVQATSATVLVDLSRANPPEISIDDLKRGRALLRVVDHHLDRFADAIARGEKRDVLTEILNAAAAALVEAQAFINVSRNSNELLSGEISVRARLAACRKKVA